MGLIGSKCKSQARLDGKTAIVTGSNTGIGKETAKDFFIRGARVIMACRNLEKANEAAEDIKRECAQNENLGQILVTKLDLMSLTSVRLCAKSILETESRVDLLINNAGIMACPKTKTEDGFEAQLGTNHLGHFLLTMLLLPKICQSTPARIVNVSSLAHWTGIIDFNDLHFQKRPYTPHAAYSQSKLANILFTKELARRLRDAGVKGVNVYCLHPGVIHTELGRHLGDSYFPGLTWIFRSFMRMFMKSPKQGAQTTIYCAVDEKCANENGFFYRECAISQLAIKQASNPETASRLWDESLAMVGLEKDYNPFA